MPAVAITTTLLAILLIAGTTGSRAGELLPVPDRLVVLTLHGVPDVKHPWVNTDRAAFQRCMKYLKENKYTVIAMRDLARYVDPTTEPSEPLAPIERRVRLQPAELRCEYLVDPPGIDTRKPRFSWVLQSPGRGQVQTAYRVLVASSEEKLQGNIGDKWDSGQVNSDRSVNVAYRGKALASSEKCYWKVRVWDKQGRPSAWSTPGSFEMGLLKQSDWKGHWIGVGPDSLSYVAGKLHRAVQLDGEGETIRIPHSAKLKPAAQITISAWIKPTECTDAWREIYRKEDDDARHLLAIGKTDGLWGLWCGLGIDGSYVERGTGLGKDYLGGGRWATSDRGPSASFSKLGAGGRGPTVPGVELRMAA